MGFAESKDLFAQASDRIALCILFLTGLRISNLKRITVGELKSFFKGGELRVTLVKSKKDHIMSYPMSNTYRERLDELFYEQEFSLFFNTKTDPQEEAWPMSRETLNKRINFILKKASLKTGKNFKSHSFRIGLCTAITDEFTIYEAQQMMGHAHLSTTQRYSRGTLTKREKHDILNKVLAEKKQ
jgi:site-specific recombinase XerD